MHGVRAPDYQAESWLETIHQLWVATLDGIRDAVFVLDSECRLIRANLAFSRLVGAENIKTIIGQSALPLIPWEWSDSPDNQIVSVGDDTYRVRISPSRTDQKERICIVENLTGPSSVDIAQSIYRPDDGPAMVETVESLSQALAAKDPYTCYHSLHVASLAKLIAIELGLRSTTAHGIYLGAKIHDIGKLAIPSEILNKPGKLVQAEMNLIQLHSESGYAIVKNMAFPWPVHDIILQHHERLDGSGYPNNLRGLEISDAARIVAVADVVEAMSAHRPYRASLGTKAAIDEIKSGRQKRYDADVVDACIAVLSGPDANFRSET